MPSSYDKDLIISQLNMELSQERQNNRDLRERIQYKDKEERNFNLLEKEIGMLEQLKDQQKKVIETCEEKLDEKIRMLEHEKNQIIIMYQNQLENFERECELRCNNYIKNTFGRIKDGKKKKKSIKRKKSKGKKF